jgi:predicted extracellular nuclease
MSVGNSYVGTYTGTGAAINLLLGFIPDHIRVINITDGNAGAEWFKATPGTTVALAGALSKVTSNGINAYAGTVGGNAPGVTLGTTVSVTGKVYHYIASRGK